jgi:thiol-disulfide isomerase/thioredoxin
MMKSQMIVLLISCVIYSCSSSNFHDANKITVAGKICGIESGEVKIISFLELEEMVVDSINKEGSFNLTFNKNESGYFFLLGAGNQTPLFLKPGDSIYITFDIEDIEGTYKSSGDMAKEALYLMEFKKILAVPDFNFPYVMYLAKERNTYFAKLDTVVKSMEMSYDSLRFIEGINKEFLAVQKAQIKYWALNQERMFPVHHRRISGLNQTDEIDFDEEKTWKKIAAVDFDTPILLKSLGGFDLLSSYINRSVLEIIERDHDGQVAEDEFLEITFSVADSLLAKARIRDHVKYVALKSSMEIHSPLKFSELANRFLSENTFQPYSEKITKILENWDPISPGMEVPDFGFTNVKGNEVRLSELQAKMIYIKIWATWCGPCRAEQPHWDNLMEEYNSSDIAFLSISIDNSRTPWENMVNEKMMGGYNWFAENAWQAEIVEHFNIIEIPRYILIDEKRRIIGSSVEKPSGNIRNVFKKYL